MAIFTDPIREHADFGPGDAEWLHLLVGDWQMVADLAFADLALWFPHPDLGYIALAHVRPSTTHTVFHGDFVGEGIRSDLQPLVDKAWNSRSIERSSETNWSSDMALRVEAVPMVRNGRTLAVVTTHMDLSSSRMPSRLELTYRQCAYDLLRMGTLGLWPDFASPTGSSSDGSVCATGPVLFQKPALRDGFRLIFTYYEAKAVSGSAPSLPTTAIQAARYHACAIVHHFLPHLGAW